MTKEDLVNLWDEFVGERQKQHPEFSSLPSFGAFMQWLKENDTRTVANPYIYDQPELDSERMAYNPSNQTIAGKPIADVLQTGDTCLTGKEFYERFKYELEALKMDATIGTLLEALAYINRLKREVEKAARKAAGLDENGEVI